MSQSPFAALSPTILVSVSEVGLSTSSSIAFTYYILRFDPIICLEISAFFIQFISSLCKEFHKDIDRKLQRAKVFLV